MNPDQCIKLNTGQLMPIVGLGTFAANGDVMRETLRVALTCGYRSIDTAYLYLNEDAIGDELQEWFSSGKLKREDVFITSKLPCIGNNRKDVKRFLQKTLANLKVDYLDCYLFHQPFAFKTDSDDRPEPRDENGYMILDNTISLEDTYRGLEDLVDAGLTKSIGISNFNSLQVERIMKIARIAPAIQQIEAHVYMQQRPLAALCRKYGITIAAYGPLGAPYREQDVNDEYPLLLKHPKVIQIAETHQRTVAQVLLRFLIQLGYVVLPKSATPSRIRENFQVFDFSLTEKEMKELEALDRAEKGRVLDFTKIFLGIKNHKEYPFHIPY